ncbi:MAG: hypothetical protein NW217_02985 [Hyphomicrobiaceae bacterium]|nr:hypothetical protein [Hyphomicrobiaceae bacterium]
MSQRKSIGTSRMTGGVRAPVDAIEIIVRNDWQAKKVMALMWLMVAVAVGASIVGWLIFASHGLSPADGGVLRPVGERLAFGGFVAALGLGCLYGMMVYGSVYVAGMQREGDAITVETLTPFGRRARRFTVGDFGPATFHRGKLQARVSVNAPYLTLPVTGWMLPLVVDLQSEVVALEAA